MKDEERRHNPKIREFPMAISGSELFTSLRGDATETFKMVRGVYDRDATPDLLWPVHENANSTTRGHPVQTLEDEEQTKSLTVFFCIIDMRNNLHRYVSYECEVIWAKTRQVLEGPRSTVEGVLRNIGHPSLYVTYLNCSWIYTLKPSSCIYTGNISK